VPRTPLGDLTALPRPSRCIGVGKGKGWEARGGQERGEGRVGETGGEGSLREEGKEWDPHFLGQVYAPDIVSVI